MIAVGIAPPIRAVARAEDEYPRRFERLSDPPPRIFVAGAALSERPAVAIVGARRASELGRRMARALARGAAEQGLIVVSGGAIGIDAEAHRGAIEAGGATWIVLPTPITAPGPRVNRGLFSAALEAGGSWIAEREHGPAHRSAFVTRNRLIAALADVLVVVEAAEPSGTSATARAARRLGKPIGAVPWSVGDPRGAGCVRLLSRGAAVITSVEDLLRLAGTPRRRRSRQRPQVGPPLVDALNKLGGATVEALALAMKRTVPEVLAELTALELEGWITRSPGGLYAAGQPALDWPPT